jgi:hypothetical protein
MVLRSVQTVKGSDIHSGGSKCSHSAASTCVRQMATVVQSVSTVRSRAARKSPFSVAKHN